MQKKEDDSFKAFIRCRPLSQREITVKRLNITRVVDQNIFISDPENKMEMHFNFDYVFNTDSCNQQVYQVVMVPLIDNYLKGYNSTVFAYGMTGSGKTYTMFGQSFQKGLLHLTLSRLCQFQQNSYKISYLQIYNQQVNDLLGYNSYNLSIVEDPIKGIFVPELSERVISEYENVESIILEGNERRVMASTNQNQFSSRSHAIIQVSLNNSQKLCLIDLAGSQKATQKGLRLYQGSNINKSLLALGNCINILSDKRKKASFVPYRDSKLTRLLKQSLGGNTKTNMIGCISPSILNYQQTLNTLKYTSRIKKIEKTVTIQMRKSFDNEYKGQIEILRNEVKYLRGELCRKSLIPRCFEVPILNQIERLFKDMISLTQQLRKFKQQDPQYYEILQQLEVKQQQKSQLEMEIYSIYQNNKILEQKVRIMEGMLKRGKENRNRKNFNNQNNQAKTMSQLGFKNNKNHTQIKIKTNSLQSIRKQYKKWRYLIYKMLDEGILDSQQIKSVTDYQGFMTQQDKKLKEIVIKLANGQKNTQKCNLHLIKVKQFLNQLYQCK